MTTKDDLLAAFAGESQANRKYLAFAKIADEEGFPQVAKLFRAAAEAETIHAPAHLRVVGGGSKAHWRICRRPSKGRPMSLKRCIQTF